MRRPPWAGAPRSCGTFPIGGATHHSTDLRHSKAALSAVASDIDGLKNTPLTAHELLPKTEPRRRYLFFFFGFPFRRPSFSWAFRVLCLRRSLRNCTACLFLHDLPPICALSFCWPEVREMIPRQFRGWRHFTDYITCVNNRSSLAGWTRCLRHWPFL